jgi:hypothetical protein
MLFTEESKGDGLDMEKCHHQMYKHELTTKEISVTFEEVCL